MTSKLVNSNISDIRPETDAPTPLKLISYSHVHLLRHETNTTWASISEIGGSFKTLFFSPENPTVHFERIKGFPSQNPPFSLGETSSARS